MCSAEQVECLGADGEVGSDDVDREETARQSGMHRADKWVCRGEVQCGMVRSRKPRHGGTPAGEVMLKPNCTHERRAW
jgi:hypothetical protein